MGSEDVIPECSYRESSAFKINMFWIPTCAGMTPFCVTLPWPCITGARFAPITGVSKAYFYTILKNNILFI